MFEPPRCPYSDCPAHTEAQADVFYVRHGYYHPKCRAWRVPRFRCRCCERTFSRQTFRADRQDHRPDLNAQVFSRLVSGGGLRQTARELGISRGSLENKFRKMSCHLRQLHEHLIGESTGHLELSFDEMETFETCRVTQPLTLPILIGRKTMFIFDARCAPIPPLRRSVPARRRKIERYEAKHGRRPNCSRECVRRVLETAEKRCKGVTSVRFITDIKTTYPKSITSVFAGREIEHVRISSKLPRTPSNPLHRINLTNAIARDLCGRLRRRSWLVSKLACYLDSQLCLLMCYRNYHRPRFNGEEESPAMLAGFIDQRLSREQLLGWRQDWGRERCIHPASAASRLVSVAGYRPTRRAMVVS